MFKVQFKNDSGQWCIALTFEDLQEALEYMKEMDNILGAHTTQYVPHRLLITTELTWEMD